MSWSWKLEKLCVAAYVVLSNVFELFVGIQEVIEDADGRNKQNTLLAVVHSNNKFVQFTVLINEHEQLCFARSTALWMCDSPLSTKHWFVSERSCWLILKNYSKHRKVSRSAAPTKLQTRLKIMLGWRYTSQENGLTTCDFSTIFRELFDSVFCCRAWQVHDNAWRLLDAENLLKNNKNQQLLWKPWFQQVLH